MEYADNLDIDVFEPYVYPCSDESLKRIQKLSDWKKWGYKELANIGKILNVDEVADNPYRNAETDLSDTTMAVGNIRKGLANTYDGLMYEYFVIESIPYSTDMTDAMRKFISLRMLYMGTYVKKLCDDKIKLTRELWTDLFKRYAETYNAITVADDILSKYRSINTNSGNAKLRVMSLLMDYTGKTELDKALILANSV